MTAPAIYDRVRYVGPSQGQVVTGSLGYVIEDYGDGNFEVEFSASHDGTTYGVLVVPATQLERAEAR